MNMHGAGMSDFLEIFGRFYGLDWATLLLGVSASFLITGGRLKPGFIVNAMACVAALIVAVMSGQTGFVVYNILLFAMNMRGLARGDRRASSHAEITPRASAQAPVPAQ